MGVTAALAGMLLIAVPAGAAGAVEGSEAADAVTEIETPASPPPAGGADTEPAANSSADEAPEQTEADAPVAEAAATDRKISGTVKFPAGMTLAQKRSLRVYINKDGATSAGIRYIYGMPGFSYNPTAAGTTATWTVSGLNRIKYHIWVDVAATGYQSAPLYMGPPNAATGYDGPIDLTNQSFTAPVQDINVGSVSVTVSAEMSVKGAYDLTLVNQQTGAETDVRNSVFSGDTVGNVNNSRHDFNGTPGTYILRAKLTNNGVKLYYDGTIFGTRDISEATPFKIERHQRIKLKQFDLREFMDVPVDHKFADDIDWLAREGITTGVKQANGTLKFLPKDTVSREAMVAFLFRLDPESGSYKVKGKSPFTDVTPKHKFYKQIMWAYENKVTTGTKQLDGSRKFLPGDRITREAMAAFMYRQYKAEISTKPGAKKLVDVPKGHKFYNEITWMSSNGITTGVKQANGSLAFEPKDRTSREATAAFLHRAEMKK
ncbi:S-layer homology domain-containing protein [Leucobacter sp. HY1910]